MTRTTKDAMQIRRQKVQAAILARAKEAVGRWVRLASLFESGTPEYMTAYEDFFRGGRSIEGVEFSNPGEARWGGRVWFRQRAEI